MIRFLSALVLATSLCVQAGVSAAHAATPDFDTVRAGYVSSEGQLIDRAGEPLAERRVDLHGRRLSWVPLDQLSPALLEALIEAEDRRFYSHDGVDLRAFAAAVVQNLWFEHARGASTLTMQLAGMLDPALRPGAREGGRRSLEQKFDQAVAAQELDARWSKAEILEAYLNLVPFRGELVGVHATAWALFGKHPRTLDRAEAALLVAMLRAPNASAAKVGWRACELLRRIGHAEECDRARALTAGFESLHMAPRWQAAPQLARRLPLIPGEALKTVLDAHWQRRMLAALEAAAPGQGAVVVLDNRTGAVLADVGGVAFSHADATEVRRPIGPLFRPVAAALALDSSRVTAATLFGDPAGGAHSLREWIRLGRWPAEAAVYALPARRDLMLELLRGPGQGLRSIQSARLNLAELAAWHRMLATDGQWRAPYWLASEQAVPVPLCSPMAAFIAMDLFGPLWSAETESGQSAWAVGGNEEVTIAVWLSMGPTARIEARSWIDAQLAEAGGWPPERVVPVGVVQGWVRFDPPTEADRFEWFLRGTAITVAEAPRLVASILAPAARAIIGRDDLSDGLLVLQADRQDPRLRWWVDGVLVASGGVGRWRPSPGLHSIELRDEHGRSIARHSVAVRAEAVVR